MNAYEDAVGPIPIGWMMFWSEDAPIPKGWKLVVKDKLLLDPGQIVIQK